MTLHTEMCKKGEVTSGEEGHDVEESDHPGRGESMTKQAETPETGTVAVRRQGQLGVSSSEEHKSFYREQRPHAALEVLTKGSHEGES